MQNSDWISFLAYPNLFGIKSFVVVVVVLLIMQKEKKSSLIRVMHLNIFPFASWFRQNKFY
jgi:hypothetical protein